MQAVIWMLGSLASFSVLAIAVRELSGDVSIPQILFFRSFIGLACLSFLIFVVLGKHKGKKPTDYIMTQRLGAHTARSFVHFLGQCGWFLGIALLPLAEVFALEFTMPLWAMIFSLVFLGESLNLSKACAIVLGMIGVVVIVEPNYSFNSIASFIVLGAAICYAIAHGYTKMLSTTDDALTILFYSCLLQMPFALSLSLAHWAWPTWTQAGYLVIVGLSALLAHYCVSKAMIYGTLSQVITLDFLRLPLIGALGVLLYQESFSSNLVLGAVLMLLANLCILPPRLRPRLPGVGNKIALEKIPH